MNDLILFAQSLVIGLSIAAPVGPIGLLTIQRCLNFGPRAGFATGLGAAAADAVYGAIGAFGVTWLISTLSAGRLPLALFGGAYLLWLAWQLLRAPATVGTGATTSTTGYGRFFAGTFVLTVANPATIFSFIAIFGAKAGGTRVVSPWWMVGGVFVGSALWWLLLCGLVGRLRHRFDVTWMRRINRLSAAVLAGFALWALLDALRH